MGKGGIDNTVRSRVRELMAAHPYHPQRTGDGSWTQPYLVVDAVDDLWIGPERLTDDQVKMFLSAGGDLPFSRVKNLLQPSSGRIYTQDLFAAVCKDIMEGYAMSDQEIARMETDRRTIRDNLNTPADASA